MTTLKVKIETLEQSLASVSETVKAAEAGNKKPAQHTLSFPSWELLHRVLAPKRLEIVQVMTGQGPLSVREVARRVGRDFKGVHSDVDMLLGSGVIDRAEGGGVVFPYDRIHLEFDIEAAA
ncbi:transcriptional regulator [Neorhizobium sp. CSC1952]|uniref:HVO_A0114 family putative DNA-binding protein n=1 Tax=Neorhizobium sp. CSC1952 TaxID=2978974 RepID=UPI0025A5D582|nr:transcriptional regulator [Rhizobium sp. CSC1952]WJR67715.1 transcriptional regulator [Rhizobium sp. CSC1952]